MKDFENGLKVIGTDLGYGNIKTANTVTPTGISVYDTEPIFQGNILEYNGKYYRIGENHKEFIADKSVDEDFYILNLMAVARELQREGVYNTRVYLATGLPLTWVRSQRSSFKAYLMKNKVVDFRYNDHDFHIEFVGCSIYPQGYPAIVERIKEFKGTNILADIGNGTMNILYIQNKKPVESKSWTEKIGVNQCVIRIKNTVMDMYGVKIDDSIVEQFLRFGKADISDKYLKILYKTAVEYAEDIFSALRKYEYNSELMKLYIIGGGGCIIRNFADYDKERVIIIDDICATAKGFEYLAYMQMRRKQNAG